MTRSFELLCFCSLPIHIQWPLSDSTSWLCSTVAQHRARCVTQGHGAVVVGGDFNCRPDDFEMKLLRTLLPELHDSWALMHPHEPGYTSNSGDQDKGMWDCPGMTLEACMPP